MQPPLNLAGLWSVRTVAFGYDDIECSAEGWVAITFVSDPSCVGVPVTLRFNSLLYEDGGYVSPPSVDAGISNVYRYIILF